MEIQNLTASELESLKSSRRESEWNRVCDSVKRAISRERYERRERARAALRKAGRS